MNNNTENNQQPIITNAVPVVPSTSAPVTPTAPAAPVVSAPTAPVASAPAAPVVPTEVVSAAPATAPVKVDTELANQHLQLIDDKPKLNIVTQEQIDAKQQEADAAAAAEPAKTEKSGGGCLSNVFLFILFGGLLVFILYIDQVKLYIDEWKKGGSGEEVQEITSGTLKCSSERQTSNMDYTYSANFGFRDKKLKTFTYNIEIRGDEELDAEALSALETECKLVEQYAGDLGGIDVTCSLENGLFKQKQIFTYDSIEREQAMTAFVEAGGKYPEYKKDQNIDEIEKEMNAANYTCERIK